MTEEKKKNNRRWLNLFFIAAEAVVIIIFGFTSKYSPATINPGTNSTSFDEYDFKT
jgi:hypothetical protein